MRERMFFLQSIRNLFARAQVSPPPPPPARDGVAGEPASTTTTAHPNGHFYSPVVDTEELRSRTEELWPAAPKIAGIDFNDVSHEDILRNSFAQFIPAYDYPEVLPEAAEPWAFFTQNSQFSWLDARAFFVLLRRWQPRRLIEIGSGFSTLLAADVNRRFFDDKLDITCIEPYPREFLTLGVPGVSRLLQTKVQNVDLAEFDRLESGDVLFIDSSHVAKTGSDVNFIYFEILPRLAPGVHIHIHDIFLPHEYPREWVLDENRSWNEQYVLRALLMDSRRYAVEFGSNYAFHRFPQLVRDGLRLPSGRGFGGGSLWIRTRER